jgi:hypothetical protein
MEPSYGFSLTINIQDEDWTITDPEDPENGWSRATYHFSSRKAIRNFFISGFEGSRNSYLNEVSYELRAKAFGKDLVSMNKERAEILCKTQYDFLDKISVLELNATYELSNTMYFSILPLVIRH